MLESKPARSHSGGRKNNKIEINTSNCCCNTKRTVWAKGVMQLLATRRRVEQHLERAKVTKDRSTQQLQHFTMCQCK